jgi:hypothetical protein
MGIDANIAMGFQPPKIDSPINALTQMMQVQGLQNQNSLAQYGLNKAQRSDDEQNRLAQLMAGGTIDPTTPEGQAKIYGAAPLTGSQFVQGMLKNRESLSTIGKNTSQAANFDASATAKSVETARGALGNVNDPTSASAWMNGVFSDPHLKPLTGGSTLEQALAKIPTDPEGFQQWKQQMSLGATKFMELNKPSIHMQDTGNASNVVSVPGLGGAPQTLSTTPKSVSPNTTATISKDYAINGINPDGTPGGDVESMAQAIAAGKLAPINGFALARPRGQAIMARVMEVNPNYDAGDYAAKLAALKGFATGKEGTALRSFNVASDHLDTLGQMADALNNGNVQVLNQIGNAWNKATGNPAPTDFEAVKTIVGKEVVKAIVAGGGGVGEREELSKLLTSANSPDQLKGVITHFKDLMDAQKAGLMDQYQRTTGRTDGEQVFAAHRGTNATAGSLPQVTNAADYEKVPKGTQYTSPDGKTRTKQ